MLLQVHVQEAKVGKNELALVVFVHVLDHAADHALYYFMIVFVLGH